MQLMFMVVLFGGLAYMFLTILRNQDAMLRTLREDNARLAERLLHLERLLAAPEAHAVDRLLQDDEIAPHFVADPPADSATPSDAKSSRRNAMLSDLPVPRRQGWKDLFASGPSRKTKNNARRPPNFYSPQEQTQNEPLHGKRTDELHLDWPEPSAKNESRSESGGMPELRL